MTADEKTAIARFLNLAANYLKDGYRREREIPVFPEEQNSAVEEPGPVQVKLPLAYQVDEEEDEQAPEYSTDISGDSLEAVAAEIRTCKACGLAPARTLAVPGEGVERPLVMVIGEGPGADEDRAGRPFVGRAGQLLDRMLQSIGLSREKNCFIANTVKCRPPGNRYPAPEEIAACFPYLQRQIALLRPKMILCAGRAAAQNLLKTSVGINALRGTFGEFRMNLDTPQQSSGVSSSHKVLDSGYKPYDHRRTAGFVTLATNKSDGLSFEGNDDDTEETTIPVFFILHPSALLRDESLKRPAWEDLKLLKARLDSLGEE